MVEFIPSGHPTTLVVVKETKNTTNPIGFVINVPAIGFRFAADNTSTAFKSKDLRAIADKLEELEREERK